MEISDDAPGPVDVLLLCGAERGHINILFLTGGELDFLDGAVQAQILRLIHSFSSRRADEIITCVSCQRSYKADILPPDNKKTRTRRGMGFVEKEKITP